MQKNRIPLLLAVLTIPFINACQPQSNDKLEQDISALQQDIQQLRQELTNIGTQVNDIHAVATRSRKPQAKTLPTQVNYTADGEVPLLGDAGAKLAIIEFSDYQCPYCKRFIDQTFDKLKTNYIDVGKVQYLTRDFPLSFHPKAKGAAVAANCSLQQDAYWPMRSALFNNMKQLGDELYQQTATSLSLDMTKFSDCLSEPQVLSKVEADMALGTSLGIRGTPSFVIGRIENDKLVDPQLVVGAQSYETFVLLLDGLMKKKTEEN